MRVLHLLRTAVRGLCTIHEMIVECFENFICEFLVSIYDHLRSLEDILYNLKKTLG
jgi:hypothetical protein